MTLRVWRRRRGPVPLKVAHLTTVDMSLVLLLEPQLRAVVDAGGEAIGISADGPLVPELAAHGIRHVALRASTRGWNLRADLRSAGQLWRILRIERPTILHTHNPKPGIYGRIVGRLAGVPIVVNTVHGLYATETDSWKRRLAVYGLERLASIFSDAELIQNPEDVTTIRRFHLAARRKVTLLGNGVDVGTFADPALAERRSEVRSAWGVGDEAIVLGTVGRLVAEKGYAELFEAVAGLTSGSLPLVLVVVGPHDPDKSDAMDETVLERARASGVVFLGMRDDVAEQMSGFDMFVLASHREGFPRAAMEAAAAGLAIIATDIRGCRQVVDDRVTGRLVPVGDALALRSSISELAGDGALRQAMGEAGRRKAIAEFDERRVVTTVMDTYRSIARRKRLDVTFDSESPTG